MQKKKRKTNSLALSAVLSAFGVILLYLGSLIDVLDLSAAAMASLIPAVLIVELGKRWSLAAFAVISGLSLLLLPQKSPAAIFVLFAGWYPIFQSLVSSLSRVTSLLLKLLAFNVGLTLMILASVYLFRFPDSLFTFSFPVYLLANPAFLLYDVALSRFLRVYVRVYRKRLHLDNK